MHILLKLAATAALSLTLPTFAADQTLATPTPRTQQAQAPQRQNPPVDCADAQRSGDPAKTAACLNAKVPPKRHPAAEEGKPPLGSEEIIKRSPNQLGITRGY